MIIYVIIAFVAILIGMAISVSAFGTGGKRKKIFQDIYFSVEDVDGIGVLYTKTGEYSAILKMENPVQKYSANIDSYYEFNHLVTALAQTLGEGYAIHKQDVFVRKQFQDESNDNHEFLSESYFKYFNGRSYTDSQTYLIITQENKKSRIFSFDNKKWRDFMVKIRKVKDQLKDSGVEASYLDGNTAREYVDRYFSMNFNDKTVSMTNFKVDEESISMGNKRCKVYSLVDVDCVSTPSIVRPFTNIEVNNVSMPVDMVSLVDCIPSADVVVYNQMFFIPNQKRELSLLDKKKIHKQIDACLDEAFPNSSSYKENDLEGDVTFGNFEMGQFEPIDRTEKNRSEQYVDKFMVDADFTVRPRKQIYIREETHERIMKLVNVVGKGQVSMSSYIDNIINEHFNVYDAEIKTAFEKSIKAYGL